MSRSGFAAAPSPEIHGGEQKKAFTASLANNDVFLLGPGKGAHPAGRAGALLAAVLGDALLVELVAAPRGEQAAATSARLVAQGAGHVVEEF